jgi:ferritin
VDALIRTVRHVNDQPMTPPVGASVWDREMFDHLTNHLEQEGALLDEYVQAAEGTESKALAYLIGLLVEDERRHHRQFAELASSLKSVAELRAIDPVVPRLDFHRSDHDAVLEVTRRLLDHEVADADELKRLRKDLRDVEDTTLWALLIEIMQRDTDKHIEILRFVERHAKKSRR